MSEVKKNELPKKPVVKKDSVKKPVGRPASKKPVADSTKADKCQAAELAELRLFKQKALEEFEHLSDVRNQLWADHGRLTVELQNKTSECDMLRAQLDMAQKEITTVKGKAVTNKFNINIHMS